MANKWFTVSYRTEKGQGDYGSDWKCVYDGTGLKEADVTDFAARLSLKFQVQVFTGKTLGKLFAEFNNGVRL